MNRALYAAASGMGAEQQNLDVIAANLASADVPAFAQRMIAFQSEKDQQGHILGVREVGVSTAFTQGRLEKSGGPCDLAIRGKGFFVVQHGAEVGYTRAGDFHRNASGQLENTDGWHLAGVRIPTAAREIVITPDGQVRIRDDQGEMHGVAHLRLAQFANPQHLTALTPTLFSRSPDSGAPVLVRPGKNNGPELCFGMLERSSVSIVEAMMQILDAQRAYEADAKGVQAADEMVRLANNLQRG